MRPVRVPPSDRDAIRRVARMADSDFETLVRVFQAEGDTLSRSDLVSAVSGALDLKTNDAEVLLAAFLGAQSVRFRRKASAAEVAGAVSQDSNLELSDDESSKLGERLARILDVNEVAVLARAAELLAEDDKTFCQARTLSDLRPVFAFGGEELEMAGVLIRHSLKLRYHVEGRVADTEAFFLTVDEAALRELRDTLDRAIEKGRVLRATATAAGLRVVDIEDAH